MNTKNVLVLITIIALISVTCAPCAVLARTQYLTEKDGYAFYDFEGEVSGFRPALPGWTLGANYAVKETGDVGHGSALNLGTEREAAWLEPSDVPLESGRVHFGMDIKMPEMEKAPDRRFFYLGIVDGMCKSLKQSQYNYTEVNVIEANSWHGKNEFTMHLSDDTIDFGFKNLTSVSAWLHLDVVADIEKLETPQPNTWHDMTNITITHKVKLTYYLSGADGIIRTAKNERLIADGFVGFCVSGGVDTGNTELSTFIDNVYVSVLGDGERPALSIVDSDGRIVAANNGKIAFNLNDNVPKDILEKAVVISDEYGNKLSGGYSITAAENGRSFEIVTNGLANGEYTVITDNSAVGTNFNTSMCVPCKFIVGKLSKMYDLNNVAELPDGLMSEEKGCSIVPSDSGNAIAIKGENKRAENGVMVAAYAPVTSGKIKYAFDLRCETGDLRVYTHNGLTGLDFKHYDMTCGIQQLIKCSAKKPGILSIHNDKPYLKKDKVQNIIWHYGEWNKFEIEVNVTSASLCDINVYVNGALGALCKDRPIDFGFAGIHFLADGTTYINNVSVEYSAGE